MKKVLFIFVLIFITVNLISCSVSDVFKKNPAATSLSGLLVEQTSDDQYVGSHLLVDDSGDIISPLRSLSINLSSNKYLNNKAQIMGTVNVSDNVFEVSGISVLEVVASNKIGHDLIEYKNTDLGFKLKYYSDWKILENGNVIMFLPPSDSGNILEDQDKIPTIDKVVITQSPFQYDVPPSTEPLIDTSPADAAEVDGVPTNESEPAVEIDVSKDALKAYAKENLKDISNVDILFRKVGIDKMNALKVDKTGNDVDYFLYRSGFVYKFSFVSGITSTIEENKNIFNEMLAEFQFLGFTVEDNGDLNKPVDEPADTPTDTPADTPADSGLNMTNSEVFTADIEGMSSFESSIYHFIVQYPEDWYYAGVKGTTPDILHRYAFSDKSVDGDSGLVNLEVMAESKPNGQSTSGGIFTVYTTVDGRTYKISGETAYKDIILAIAKSITPVKTVVQ
ncbi:MAG: hypothetical protein WC285_01825 [Candidatus Gracilibacteria bacterium]|jgi:hypothetical protein